MSPTRRAAQARLVAAASIAAAVTAAIAALLVPARISAQDDVPRWRTMKEKGPSSQASAEIRKEIETCLECHTDPSDKKLPSGEAVRLGVDAKAMESSVHGKHLRCTDCHTGIGWDPDAMEHKYTQAADRAQFRQGLEKACMDCHSDAAADYGGGAHRGARNGPACVECHGSHGVPRASRKTAPVSESCGRCHAKERAEHTGSRHEKMCVSCADCHGAHRTIGGNLDLAATTAFCGKCHVEVSNRFKGSAHEGAETGCTDCHGKHRTVMRKNDRGTIDKGCADCHETEAAEVSKSAHGKAGGPTCASCHDPHKPSKKAGNKDAASSCSGCHVDAVREYSTGAHCSSDTGPSCAKCHGTHAVSGGGAIKVSCESCHGAAAKELSSGAHAGRNGPKCSQCHGHDARGKTAKSGMTDSCLSCHKTLGDYRSKNLHEIALRNGIPGAPGCVTCHGKAHAPLPVEKGKPGGFSSQFSSKRCIECHGAGKDVAKKHGWLFQAEHHFSGKLECSHCHMPFEGEIRPFAGRQHVLSRDFAALKKCEDCHSPNSLLAEKLVPDGKPNPVFTGGPLSERFGYVMGATRIRLLDLVGGLLVIATFFGMCFGHGGLRILGNALRKKH